MTDYHVNLDIYNGPMDLLLYLIRRDEVDVHDIPIARVTQQYCAYVETLKMLDPDAAGEFLVMAATLMEIKTRMLLPRPEPAQGDEETIDPRADLVRQLLEYKVFKDAAGDLRTAAAEQSLRFPRRPAEMVVEQPGKDLEEVNIWDLMEAFNNLMSAVGQDLRETKIILDDTPVELHADDILDRLRREGNLTFRQVFAGRTVRTELVGLFLALLELVRRRSIYVEQEGPFGEIYISAVKADRQEGADMAADRREASAQAGPGQSDHVAQDQGRYEPTDDDGRRSETQGVGD